MDQETIIILKALLLPPGGLIVLLLISLLFIRGVFGKLLLTLTLVMFYLFSTPFVGTNLLAGLERHVFITPEELIANKVEAIVVLGGGLYKEGPEYGGDSIKGQLLERVRYAAWLQKRTKLPIIISGGGIQKSQKSEAKLAAQVLKEEFGCRVIALEEKSVSTWENAQFTSRMLKDQGINQIALVTHTWHMPRAVTAFQRNRVKVIAAPTIYSKGKISINGSRLTDWFPSSMAFRNSYLALHEYLGMVWYRVKESVGV
jgi:uncharacterized SAM-binding protein YcdF (DUF218 family)